MGKYLHLYDDVTAFTQDYNGEAYIEPWASYTEENKTITLSNGKTYKLKGTIIGWADSMRSLD